MDWFLYDNGLRHERVKVGCRAMEKSLLRFGSYITTEKQAKIYLKAER